MQHGASTFGTSSLWTWMRFALDLFSLCVANKLSCWLIQMSVMISIIINYMQVKQNDTLVLYYNHSLVHFCSAGIVTILMK